MFPRIMAVVLAVILLLAIAFGAVGFFAVRRERINARLDALTVQARDLARLSVESRNSTLYSRGRTIHDYYPWQSGQSTADAAYRYLNRKANEIYREYGAYIAVANRVSGQWVRVSTNLNIAADEDPDFVASLNSEELSSSLERVLQGEEITVRVMVHGDAVFTVGVPFVQNEQVMGAVLIQTRAQRIEGDVWEIAWPLALLSLAAAGLAGVALFFLLRRQLRPLSELRNAAESLSEGDFTVRVENCESVPEFAALSGAFNSMADKLGAVEQGRREFVANVSHELRSPITSISGFVQGMEDGTIPPEEHATYLTLVGTETRRLSKLVDDLLTLSRLEQDDASLTVTEFDLCEMFRRAVIRRMTDIEKHGIEIVTDFDPDPCRVRADADRIEEVLINLVDNAIKFTPEGGRITLSTSARDGLVTAAVADSGPGVPPEDRDRIFDRFFTADRAHTAGKGTGLGLSICQRIMTMHGQRIWYDGGEDGAVFRFTLPAGEEK